MLMMCREKQRRGFEDDCLDGGDEMEPLLDSSTDSDFHTPAMRARWPPLDSHRPAGLNNRRYLWGCPGVSAATNGGVWAGRRASRRRSILRLELRRPLDHSKQTSFMDPFNR